MHGLMMNMPLLVSSLLTHADRHHGDVEIVSRRVEGDLHRYTYRDAHHRARQLANALRRLGARPGDRIATLAWNGYRHLEIYYAVSGSGMVTHTINPRLFPPQINWILNHAESSVLLLDATFLKLAEAVLPACRHIRHVVLLTDRAHMPAVSHIPNLLCYEDLLAAESDDFEWPALDENTACGLCYTSGTTGDPKGALYSHRSMVLHAYAQSLPDAMCLSARDTVLPVVPMFHVNAWGIPFAAPLTGARLVFPGPGLDGASLYELFEQEQVTFTAGVPTIWLGLVHYMKQHQRKFSSLKHMLVGGAACPPALMRTVEEEFGVEVVHAWGMTELSPLGSVSKLHRKHSGLPEEQKRRLLAKQGHVIYGIDWKIVDSEGNPLPWDGKAFGDLYVRGPWVIRNYYKVEQSPLRDGWFPTGDVATIDPDGYMQITDRSKDVIKSGGEWISSIELENIAMAHPAVQEAAVIAVQHPKWDERPLLVAVRRPGLEVDAAELLRFYQGKTAKWWVPDAVEFVDELPHTATGKVQKLKLREQFRDYRLPGSEAA